MIFELNIVHLMLALAAVGCAYLALREVRRPYMSVWRLFVPPFLACGVAFGLVLIQIAADHPSWQFGAALLVGLIAGAARGLTMHVQFDAYRPRIQARPATKRVLFWVAVVVVLCVALDVVGAVQSPNLNGLRYVAAMLATFCAGTLVGRATAVMARLRLAHWT
ncbi:MAG: hypothetical protein U1E60_16460 [Reyranellaceae bacterium]